MMELGSVFVISNTENYFSCLLLIVNHTFNLQCFVTVGWAAGRASDL